MEEAAHYFKNRKPGLLAGQSGGSTILLVQQALAYEDGGIKELCRKFKKHVEECLSKYSCPNRNQYGK